jgi:hypothetical protein
MRGESPPLLHVCACMAAQLRGALLLHACARLLLGLVAAPCCW